ncbi:uncharacterized protein LOC124154113 [Ischnura elegans]|uniref:uncharacterized protein LOC124154113 n=1 Tax=Ischnura elegans TaxID=197161 RepID=UPI001ED8BCDC|nr:uncharacterized protein LOC124154113 [Ischnura elegans]
MPRNSRESHQPSQLRDISNAFKQYMELSGNSSDLFKYLSDVVEDNRLSPEMDSPVPDTLNKSTSVDGRAPSPASISSVASNRRLEWDSGADVGYQQSDGVPPVLLSTLERMALDGCTESLIRTDPEGTNSCITNKRNPIHKLIAKTDATAIADVNHSSAPVSSPREVTGVVNLSVFANNEAVSLRSVGKISSEGCSRKNSVSVSGVDDAATTSSNPGGEKDVNTRTLGEHQAADSPVDDNITSDKSIPLAPLSSAAAANSASSSSLASTIVPHNASDAMPTQSATDKSVGKVITRGVQVGGTLKKYLYGSEASSVKHFSGSDDDLRGFTMKACPNVGKGQKSSQKSGKESLDSSSFDCANSFEYVPGEVFNKDFSRRRMNERDKTNAKPSRTMSASPSLDLERNISQIREMLSRKRSSNSARKALIKSLMERIVGTENLDDSGDENPDQSPVRTRDSLVVDKGLTSSNKLESQESIDVVSEKSFVPYRPVPGGRLYHVASQAMANKGVTTSSSSSESVISKPMTCYLPVDRVKITQRSSLSSEKGSTPPLCKKCMEKGKSKKKQQSPRKKITVPKSCQEFFQEKKDDVEAEKFCCSNECRSKRNWWSPVTKSEKQHMARNAKSRRNPVITYMEHERANQLHWIKNEIKHLSNLAQLLEEFSVDKSDSPVSLEDQVSILSSVGRKNIKNIANASDKFLSSNRSTPLEDPITATMRWDNRITKKKLVRSDTPPSHDISEEMYVSDQRVVHSSTQSESQSYPSRSSSRNLTNSDVINPPKMLGRRHRNKDSEAYVITFEEGTPDKCTQSMEKEVRKPLKEVRLKVPSRPGKTKKEALDIHHGISLQEQLEVHRPHFIRSSQERQKCLEELARLRSLRQMTRRKLLHYTMSAWEDQLNGIQCDLKQKKKNPRPGLVESVNKPSSTMMGNVRKPCPRPKQRYRVLPEAKKKEAECIKKQSLQTNRIMADIFSRRLQKKVLTGAVSLSNSVSVISSL